MYFVPIYSTYKTNWLSVNDRVEHCIANTVFNNWIELYQDIFMKSLSLHSVDIAQDGIRHIFVESKYREEKLIFLRDKNMVRNKP